MVPSFALDPSWLHQLLSSPLSLLSLLIQQKAFYLFIASAVEPEDSGLSHFKCVFVLSSKPLRLILGIPHRPFLILVSHLIR